MTTLMIDEQLLTIPANIRNLRDFRRWSRTEHFPEKRRVDFIAGHVELEMAPPNFDTHNLLVMEITRVVGNIVVEAELGQLGSETARVVNPAADLSAGPDLTFISWERLESGEVRIENGAEIVGAPDLVVEVVSPSSVAKDTKRLPVAYFAAGVKEFWLVDAQQDELRFTIHRRGRKAFEPVDADKAGFVPSAVLKRSFKLVRKPAPVKQSVVYRLEQK
jgi:Uma2 family endonuclease